MIKEFHLPTTVWQVDLQCIYVFAFPLLGFFYLLTKSESKKKRWENCQEGDVPYSRDRGNKKKKKERTSQKKWWRQEELKFLLGWIICFHYLRHAYVWFVAVACSLYFPCSFSLCIQYLLSSFNFCSQAVLKTISCSQVNHPRSFYWLFFISVFSPCSCLLTQ